MHQWFNLFNGSFGSSAQSIQTYNCTNCSIASWVQLVWGFNWFEGSIGIGFNRFKGYIGLRFYCVQEFNWFNLFKGSVGSRVSLVQGFTWFKSWICLNSNVNWGNSSNNSRVQFVQVVKLFQGFFPSKLSWLAQLNLNLAQLSPSLFHTYYHDYDAVTHYMGSVKQIYHRNMTL